MNPIIQNRGRRLVPRWRSLDATLASLELAHPNKGVAPELFTAPDPDLFLRLERWQLSATLVSAAELLESAIVNGNEKVAIEAARQLIDVDTTAAPLIHTQAASVLARHGELVGETGAISTTATVRSPRQYIHLHPRDPLAWVELALKQVTAGHSQAAGRSMRIALALAPNNRHVLRSAARLFLHDKEFEKAHDLIVRNPATKTDPWLAAAEIALAEVAKRNPRCQKLGLKMLEDRAVPVRQLTELAGAVATEELLNGNRKRSRRTFELSMKDPTGSALAQGEWASTQTGSELVSASRLLTTLEAAEAQAFHLHRAGEYSKVPEVCWEWSKLDTFSIRPFEFGASVAGLVGHHEAALALAKKGLQMRPGAPELLNAVAFSLASTGRAEEAMDVLSQVRSGPDALRYLTTANWGLIAFRSGDPAAGRALYKAAIEGFKVNRPDLVARAKIYLAREALQANEPDAAALMAEAKQAAKGMNHEENNFILHLIEGGDPNINPAPRKLAPSRTVIATFPSGEQRRFVIRSS